MEAARAAGIWSRAQSSMRIDTSAAVYHDWYTTCVNDWRVVFYKTSAGASPVEEYIDTLHADDAARIIHRLEILEELGTSMRMPDARKLEDSPLWELRIRGQTAYRVFYVAIEGRRMLVLHAFQKKSQKTPRREIRTAEQRLMDYQGRMRS